MSWNIKLSDIKHALAPSIWDKGNQVLYDMCKKYPKHDDDSEIIAKVWLIGRSYSAAIERRKNAVVGADVFYETEVVNAIKESKLDQWLAKLPAKMDDPRKHLGQVIFTHKQLTDLFKSITGAENRSLASKYLHFHRPDIFYLYDTRASTAIVKIVPKLNMIETIETEIFDREYLAFCRRIQWLREKIQDEFKTTLNPRQLDKILMAFAKNA